MLSVYFGNDTVVVRKKALAFIDSHTEKGAVLERIDADSHATGILIDAAQSSSLFGTETVYLIDSPSLNRDFFEDVIEHLEILAESVNHFAVIEGTLLAPEKKKFTKYAQTCEEIKKTGQERFNAFAMADSLAKKDKRMLWVQLQEARRAGLSAEEIIGTLWWQLKSLRLAKVTTTAAEADMKDFPYNKAKRALANFKSNELEDMSSGLLLLYHRGHGGKVDIDIALEKWVLTI